MPQELRDYAKEKDIQLLTHNDPHLCILDEKLSTATKKLFGDEKFELQWSARFVFTVWCIHFVLFFTNIDLVS